MINIGADIFQSLNDIQMLLNMFNAIGHVSKIEKMKHILTESPCP
jgi:hypothetical protein